MKSIFDYKLSDLSDYFSSINEKPFKAKQVFEWLYKKRVTSFEEMTNIRKILISFGL